MVRRNPDTSNDSGRSAATGQPKAKAAASSKTPSGKPTSRVAAPRRDSRSRVGTVAVHVRSRAAAPVAITVSSAAEAGYTAEGPVARVIDALGNNVVADLLGVARSQPSRWRSRRERPSPESRKRLSDLDHVLDRLLLELHPDQAGLWLTGPNPHLGGARPVDVLELRGAAAVLPAIDALAVGAFA